MRASLKTLFAEFKAFAFKGNMIDLAVAVVIGAAFSGVINSLVKDIIMPSVSYAVTAAKSASEAATTATQHLTGTTQPSTQPATQPTTQPAEAAPPPPPPPPAPAPAPAAEKKPEEGKAVDFSFKVGRLKVGNFIAELLNFIIIAFAVFIIIVKLLGSVMKRMGGTPKPGEPTTKECPECLSVIPIKAKRCANCTSVQPPMA